MDTIKSRKCVVVDVLNDLLENHYNQAGPIEACLVADDVRGEYQIYLHGWQDMTYFYGVSIHVQVKDNDKVWILRDSSSVVIVDHLEKAGIPTSQMVISWHPPVARQHTEFAQG